METAWHKQEEHENHCLYNEVLELWSAQTIVFISFQSFRRPKLLYLHGSRSSELSNWCFDASLRFWYVIKNLCISLILKFKSFWYPHQLYIYIYIHIHICIYVCVYLYDYIYSIFWNIGHIFQKHVFLHIHIYIYIYIHIYIYDFLLIYCLCLVDRNWSFIQKLVLW